MIIFILDKSNESVIFIIIDKNNVKTLTFFTKITENLEKNS